MKYNRIIIILITLMILLIAGMMTANAETFTDTFVNRNNWDAGTVSDNTLHLVGYPNTYQTSNTATTHPATVFCMEFDMSFKYQPTLAWQRLSINKEATTFPQLDIYGGTNNYIRIYKDGYSYTQFSYTHWSTEAIHHVQWLSNNDGQFVSFDGEEVGSVVEKASWPDKKITLQANGDNIDIKNFYYDTTATEQVFSVDTTYKGYVKDANGNPLEYCNVTLWDGNAYGTTLLSDITDANGYYEIVPQTVDISGLYNISIKPPNSYYTNLYGFAANATTPLTFNFTVNPARVQIYAYDTSKGISTGDLNTVNFTLYVSGGGLPGTITYVRIEHDSPYIFDENIPTGATVCILANKTGFVDKWNNFTSVGGWNTPAIPMSGDYSSGGTVLIVGHTRDNTGVVVMGIPLYLVRVDGGAVVSSATSSNNLLVNPGYYALQVPISAVDYEYAIIGNFPGYGNISCDLRDAGGIGDIGADDIITYSDTWTDEGLATNADLGVDAWFSLAGTYTPSATPTPSPGGSIPGAPTGYNIIGGQVYNIATGQNIPGVTVYLAYQNNTVWTSTTTDASGAYSFTFATAGLGAQSLKVIPGSTAQYDNLTSTTYVSYPFAGGATAYRNDIGMTAKAGYTTYLMSGWLYDATKGYNYRISGGSVSIWTQDGNTQISTVAVDGNGHYSLYLGQDLTPGTYIVSGQSVGFKNNNATFPFPGAFVGDGMYNLSIAMQPNIISEDNNNALGIQITDNTTGLILVHGQYTITYAANNTVYASGGMGGQNVVYLYNLPAADYFITGSYNGYTSVKYGLSIAADNWYSVNIGLNPIAAPTAIPTVTPTPSGEPAMYTNPFDALIHLLVLTGLDEGTANLMVGFIFIIGGAAAMAIVGAKIGLVANVGMTLLIGIGAAAGFALACLTGVWPIWLLLVGAFVVVIYLVYTFVSPRGGA